MWWGRVKGIVFWLAAFATVYDHINVVKAWGLIKMIDYRTAVLVAIAIIAGGSYLFDRYKEWKAKFIAKTTQIDKLQKLWDSYGLDSVKLLTEVKKVNTERQELLNDYGKVSKKIDNLSERVDKFEGKGPGNVGLQHYAASLPEK